MTRYRSWADGLQVVAVERDVERAARNPDLFALIENVGEAVAELHTSPLNSHEDQIVDSVKQLDDLVGHATEGARERARVEHGRGLGGHEGPISPRGGSN